MAAWLLQALNDARAERMPRGVQQGQLWQQPAQRQSGLSLEDLEKVLEATQRGGGKQELTLQDIKAGLPIKVQQELATALVSLSKREKMPP